MENFLSILPVYRPDFSRSVTKHIMSENSAGTILMMTRVALCGIMVVYLSVGLIVTGVVSHWGFMVFDHEMLNLVFVLRGVVFWYNVKYINLHIRPKFFGNLTMF